HWVRHRRLSTSSSDAGWAQCRTVLAYQAACAGKRVVVVEPAATSPDGSGCGARAAKSLRVRTPVGPSGRLVLDRDEHAARTIPWRGQRLRGLAAVAAGTNREPAGL